MSIEKKGEDKLKNTGLYQRPRKADNSRERYQKHTIENLIKQAEYKNSLGMEMTDSERFCLENKAFLLRKRLLEKRGY